MCQKIEPMGDITNDIKINKPLQFSKTSLLTLIIMFLLNPLSLNHPIKVDLHFLQS